MGSRRIPRRDCAAVIDARFALAIGARARRSKIMTRNPLITMVATALIASTPILVHAESQSSKVDDQQITEQVKQKLAMNDPTVAPHIVVTTHDGVVTLMGTDVP